MCVFVLGFGPYVHGTELEKCRDWVMHLLDKNRATLQEIKNPLEWTDEMLDLLSQCPRLEVFDTRRKGEDQQGALPSAIVERLVTGKLPKLKTLTLDSYAFPALCEHLHETHFDDIESLSMEIHVSDDTKCVSVLNNLCRALAQMDSLTRLSLGATACVNGTNARASVTWNLSALKDLELRFVPHTSSEAQYVDLHDFPNVVTPKLTSLTIDSVRPSTNDMFIGLCSNWPSLYTASFKILTCLTVEQQRAFGERLSTALKSGLWPSLSFVTLQGVVVADLGTALKEANRTLHGVVVNFGETDLSCIASMLKENPTIKSIWFEGTLDKAATEAQIKESEAAQTTEQKEVKEIKATPSQVELLSLRFATDALFRSFRFENLINMHLLGDVRLSSFDVVFRACPSLQEMTLDQTVCDQWVPTLTCNLLSLRLTSLPGTLVEAGEETFVKFLLAFPQMIELSITNWHTDHRDLTAEWFEQLVVHAEQGHFSRLRILKTSCWSPILELECVKKLILSLPSLLELKLPTATTMPNRSQIAQMVAETFEGRVQLESLSVS